MAQVEKLHVHVFSANPNPYILNPKPANLNPQLLIPFLAHQMLVSSLSPLGFGCSQHRQTLRPTVDGTRSKALRPFNCGVRDPGDFRGLGDDWVPFLM